MHGLRINRPETVLRQSIFFDSFRVQILKRHRKIYLFLVSDPSKEIANMSVDALFGREHFCLLLSSLYVVIHVN